MRKFIINSKQVRTNAVNAVKTITGEENLEVIIQEHKENKTQEQRNFFHLLCKILGDEIGYSQSEIKEVVKIEALGLKSVKVGDSIYSVTKSSEEAKKDEYSHLIDTLYRISAELGVNLPNPIERRYG